MWLFHHCYFRSFYAFSQVPAAEGSVVGLVVAEQVGVDWDPSEALIAVKQEEG